MIAEAGQILLLLALWAALAQGVFPLIGAHIGDHRLLQFARAAAGAQLALVATAFIALSNLHIVSDFSVRNVFENSHTAKPLLYKVTGVWGNHEGSMLLWVLILAAYGGALAAVSRMATPLKARALAVQGLVAAAFLAFVLFTSNPFARLFPAPAEGQDLNPLLQDPGLAIHPPFLYLGYVGFSIVFAFAVAGLISGRIDEVWARQVRPFALAAWGFLTVGIALGSWWAYYELGWGGFWAWDPVENASFMPWLAGTALIHSIRVLEVRGAFKAWTALLAILAFSLSLVGTFLVRSGVLTSVHAFAVDPARGIFILAILVAATGGGLTLFALRANALFSGDQRDGPTFGAISREGGLLANNVMLTAATATVFLGTFYPLFAEVTTGTKLSVGAPYFNIAFNPLALLMVLVMAPASVLAWKRGNLTRAVRQLWPALLAGGAVMILALFLTAPKSVMAILGAALAATMGVGVIVDIFRRVDIRRSGALVRFLRLPKSYLAMSAAHIGVALVMLGAIGAGAWHSEEIVYLKEGETIAIGGYEATMTSVEEIDGPNYVAQRANFDVTRGAQGAGFNLSTERRFYPVRGMQTTEAGIKTLLSGDVYLTLGDFAPERGWVVRAWVRPLTVWMWIGAGFMAMGAAIGLFGAAAPIKRRIKAPIAQSADINAKENVGVGAA